MITIYKNKALIPDSMQIVDMNDVFFNRETPDHMDSRAEAIIEKIDGAKLQGKYKITSGLNGVTLGIDKLSSGCKTALNILYFPDKVFDLAECGDNVLSVIYSFEKGNVYCKYPMISLDMEAVKIVDKNGMSVINNYEDLKEWWNNEDETCCNG